MEGRPDAIVDRDKAAHPDRHSVCGPGRIEVVEGELGARDDEHPVVDACPLRLALDLGYVLAEPFSGDASRLSAPRVPPRVVRAHDVVGDTEDVEAVHPVEVDELAQRQLAVTPGGVRVELGKEGARSRPHHIQRCWQARRPWGQKWSICREELVDADVHRHAGTLARMPTAETVSALVGDEDLAAAVAAETVAMEELLVRLVDAPTTLGNEESGQALVAAALREAGLEPVDVPMDEAALRAHPLAAPFSWPVTGKRNVVATWAAGAGEGRSLALNGHIDVVPPGGEGLWTADPFSARRDGDWLVGRGSGDMKAGLAAIVGAVRGLRRLGLAPVGDLCVQSVVEEECGGNGALQCLLAGHTADACVIPEPFPDSVSISQVGVLWFHVDVAGIPAHVGEASVGVNAIEALIPIIEALRQLEAELNQDPPPPYDELEHPINLNVGVVRGGDWPSTVAAECTLSCRLALFPGQEVAWLQARVEGVVATAAQAHPYLSAHPPVVRYDGFTGNGVEVALDEPLVQVVAAAQEAVTGSAPERVATTATTDARAFVAMGIPAVCFGPLAERIHGVDERVHLPSMVTTAQALALVVRDWCGVTA